MGNLFKGLAIVFIVIAAILFCGAFTDSLMFTNTEAADKDVTPQGATSGQEGLGQQGARQEAGQTATPVSTQTQQSNAPASEYASSAVVNYNGQSFMINAGNARRAQESWLGGQHIQPGGTHFCVAGHTCVYRTETQDVENDCGTRPPENSSAFDPWWACSDGVTAWGVVNPWLLGDNVDYTFTNNTGKVVAVLEYAWTFPEDVVVLVATNGDQYDPTEFNTVLLGNWYPGATR